MKTFAFTVQGRAAPSLNGHLDRMKRLEAWYQEVREAIRTQTGLPPQLVLSGAARAKLAAPLHLEPGERATLRVTFHFKPSKVRTADMTNLTKSLEDSIFWDDYEVVRHEIAIDRQAKEDRVDVEVEVLR